jgi:hypothetical protein
LGSAGRVAVCDDLDAPRRGGRVSLRAAGGPHAQPEVFTHSVGRFTVRVVPNPHPLYSGTRHDFSRPRHDNERDTIIEVYDPTHLHTPTGQFISAYSAATLIDFPAEQQLDLHGGVPVWTMTLERPPT